MHTVVPRNFLFAAPLRDSARTIEGWQFTILDPIEHPPDARDCLKRATEQCRLARLSCLEARFHDRLIEALSDTGRRVTQAACGGLSLLAGEGVAVVPTQTLATTRSIWR